MNSLNIGIKIGLITPAVLWEVQPFPKIIFGKMECFGDTQFHVQPVLWESRSAGGAWNWCNSIPEFSTVIP